MNAGPDREGVIFVHVISVPNVSISHRVIVRVSVTFERS